MSNSFNWLKKLQSDWSLVSQISYATAASALTLSVMLSYYAAEISRHQIELEQGKVFAQRAQSIVNTLDRAMFERYREMQIVAALDDIQNPVVPIDKKRGILEKVQQTYDSYAWIGICNTQGIGSVGTGKYLEGKDLSKRPWCTEGRNAPYLGDVHDALLLAKLLPNPTGENFYLVDVAAPVIDATGMLQGVLCGHIFWKFAEDLLGTKVQGIDVFLLSKEGLILSGPEKNRALLADLAPNTRQLIFSNTSISDKDYFLDTWNDGKTYLIGHAHDNGFRDYPGLGWTTIIRQDVNTAFAPARDLQQRILIIGIILGLIFTLIGGYLARRIAKPISQIAAAADKVAGGNFDYDPPPLPGSSETAKLSRAIHTMVSNLTSEIQERKKAEADVLKLANYDSLTGLPNRLLLNDRIDQAISASQREHSQLGVLYLDIDNFKIINDTLGHQIGDELLIEVGKRLTSTVREIDTVSRMGGDEYVIVLQSNDVEGTAHVATKLLKAVSRPYKLKQNELVVTLSIGIAMYPEDGKDFKTLYQHADVAMYRAKKNGRNNYCFFTAQMQAHSIRILQLENALRFALERNQFYLHYQPQISIQNNRVIGAEALLRWKHPEFGIVSPKEFISIAENSGQIIPIGEWVLQTAIRQLKEWIDRGLPPFIMAVNLSAVQFRHANLPDYISQTLEEAQLPPEYLELELTEGAAMDDPPTAIRIMDELHARGVRMSIDDFGTGHSSLSYLKKFNVYKLKIDQSFVRDIREDKDDRAIVTAIIQMANSLSFQTIAEGVETEEQLTFLREQNCGEAQGYYFSRSLSTEQFEAFIKGRNKFDT